MPKHGISPDVFDVMGRRVMVVETVLRSGGSDAAVAKRDATAAEAARPLSQQHVQIVLVCKDDRKIAGVATDSDILRAVARCTGGEAACCLRVSDLMTRDVVAWHREDCLDDAVTEMLQRRLRRIPVVERDGAIAGLITMREALLHLYEEAKLDEALLKEYFLGIGYR